MSRSQAKSLPVQQATPAVVIGTAAPTPTTPASPANGDLDRRVREALERIRPAVRADGGDVELVDIAAGTVRVRFKGACVGCPSSSLTLRMGIERAIRDGAPEIARVEAVA